MTRVRTGLMAALVCSATLAHAQDAPSGPPVVRLRPTTPRLATLIDEAKSLSPTFGNLVASLEATDGMVFIDEGKCPRAAPACLKLRMTQAGRHRVLFVVINTARPDVRLMASIGHELQHALEVLADPLVQTTTALRLFYLGGKSEYTRDLVETAAAQSAGDRVLREIQRSRTREHASCLYR